MTRPSIQHCVAAVAAEHGLAVADLKGRMRRGPVSQARAEAAWLARVATRRSFPVIGRALGGRDHTTVIYHVRGTAFRQLIDAELRARLARAAARIGVDLQGRRRGGPGAALLRSAARRRGQAWAQRLAVGGTITTMKRS